ncbi:hypothetical protein B5S29_g4356 [[Candida] boidinii]|nr:hypothetical protein B5S29_g4356 [[Candida] boidinii]
MTVEEEKVTSDDKPLWVLGYGSLMFKPPPFAKYKLIGYLNGYIRRFYQSSSDHRGTPDSPGRVVTLISIEDILKNEDFKKDVLNYELKNYTNKDNNKYNDKDLIFNNLEKLYELLEIYGCIYYIPPEHAKEVTEYLDIREQDGYSSHEISFNIPITDSYCDNNNNKDDEEEEELNKILTQLPKNSKSEYVIKSTVYIGKVNNESFIGPEEINKTSKIIKNSIGPSGKNIDYLIGIYNSLNNLNFKNSNCNYLNHLVELVNNKDNN